MASKNNGTSVAPKERINISYRPATGDAKAQVELPFKALVLGQFRTSEDPYNIQERETISINRQNFNEVMASMDLELNFTVPNHLNDESEELSINIQPKSLQDMEPDELALAIPELKKTLELRDALKALKGPLGNTPAMRKTIQLMLEDQGQRKKLLSELGLQSSAAKPKNENEETK
ncbi:type VI secretion system contractile sheath small subunit [Marinospirillum minutulum]|uniref:type VI secretion system contractile sheath small subunit n=1 Tax=Marinospirillum minutulum TaxID=64974 RepID=UPI0004121F6F|nr:type VI secretion system contractile sheath small subunit [Marinospirillum minutulum]